MFHTFVVFHYKRKNPSFKSFKGWDIAFFLSNGLEVVPLEKAILISENRNVILLEIDVKMVEKEFIIRWFRWLIDHNISK